LGVISIIKKVLTASFYYRVKISILFKAERLEDILFKVITSILEHIFSL